MPQPSFSDRLERLKAKMAGKVAFAPTGSMPPMDPAMMGGAPAPAPMDPAMAGGAPPMDPAAMGGAPMPADPAAMAGGMDPAMMGGAPPMDPAMAAPPPPDPASMGVMPDPSQQDPMQMMMDLTKKVDTLTEVVQKLVKKLDEGVGHSSNASSLVPKEDAAAVSDLEKEHEKMEDPVSDQAKEELEKPDEGQSFIQKQLMGLQGA